MDLKYLHFLQDFREKSGDFFTPFFLAVSKFAVSPVLIVFAVLLYWVWNKKTGEKLLVNFCAASFLNGFLKLSFCVYRPWIRDPSIFPVEEAISGATGYSFPSGHSAAAAAIFGVIAIEARKKNKAISALMLFCVVLTMFSRNYLGVHTPQDVIVGSLSTAALLFLGEKTSAFCEKNRGKVFLTQCAVCAFSAAYFIFKPYPVDFADGKILVSPLEMQGDAFSALGAFAAMSCGLYAERRFVRFQTCGASLKKIAASSVGIAVFGAIYLKADEAFTFLPPLARAFLQAFLATAFVFLYPAVLKKAEC